MANDEWENWAHFEELLQPIDPAIEYFAARHALSISRNERESVGRSMRWGTGPSALLQLYLHDADRLGWNLWACCSDDRGNERYWKEAMLVDGQQIAEFAPEIDNLLERGFADLTEWCQHPELLTFATTIAVLPKNE